MYKLIFELLSSEFAENYRSTIETTLKQMVEELQEILHSYGSGENVPRFVQLCRKLELSEKVSYTLICVHKHPRIFLTYM